MLGKTRPHPLVLLRNTRDRQDDVAVQHPQLLEEHPGADQGAPQGAQASRSRSSTKKRKDGTPLILLGDFNDRTEAFCTIVGKTDLKATIGGKASKKKCQPPKNMGIDWIFASKDISPQATTRDRNPMILRITDHPVLYSTVRFD